MKKRIALLLLLPFILGCNFLFPMEARQPAALPTQGGEISAPLKESAPQVESASAFTIIRTHVTDGALDDQLAAEAQKAQALNQTPFLEFDATWCPPCIAINESLQAQDSITIGAFAGAYVIRADVDEWGWGDQNKFKFDGIPIYYKLDGQGQPTGAVVDGSAWGENIPENFAPILDEFFHAP
jgi:thiol-disulfide isomerase/thioredoxin